MKSKKTAVAWRVSAFWRSQRQTFAWEIDAPKGIVDPQIAIKWARHDKPNWVPDEKVAWRARMRG